MDRRQTLRKDSSSRIPMRNIQALKSEDVLINRRLRKKRPLSTDSAEVRIKNIFCKKNCLDGQTSFLRLL